MIRDVYDDVLAQLARKDFLVYAPHTAKDIKRDYRELNDYEAFRKVTPTELVFVWWFAIKCSPIIDLPEEKRVLVAVEKAFRVKSQADARRIEYSTLNFPDDIKNAIKCMDRFDPGGRITAMADDLHTMTQMQHIIRKDISSATPDEVVEWMKALVPARKIRDDILLRIERGGLGVEETTAVNSASLDGLSSDFMKQQFQ